MLPQVHLAGLVVPRQLLASLVLLPRHRAAPSSAAPFAPTSCTWTCHLPRPVLWQGVNTTPRPSPGDARVSPREEALGRGGWGDGRRGRGEAQWPDLFVPRPGPANGQGWGRVRMAVPPEPMWWVPGPPTPGSPRQTTGEPSGQGRASVSGTPVAQLSLGSRRPQEGPFEQGCGTGSRCFHQWLGQGSRAVCDDGKSPCKCYCVRTRGSGSVLGQLTLPSSLLDGPSAV